jgi:transposase
LWVALTPLVSFFSVLLARSTAAAQALLGKDFRGILNSERYNAYNWLDVDQRQLCWAHLKREFTKFDHITKKLIKEQDQQDLFS